MFSGYNLTLDKSFFVEKPKSFDYYRQIGEDHMSRVKEAVCTELERYITGNVLNGSKVQDDWFPKLDADIFISHSHKDKDLANALGGWMHKTFGLKVFIDSNVWSYADDLLKIINDKYSNKRFDSDGGYLYNYDKCNQASQHVNMMLSVALQKMIDKVECIMLLNTENSIKVFENKQSSQQIMRWKYGKQN